MCLLSKSLQSLRTISVSILCPDGITPVPAGYATADPSMDYMFYKLTANWLSVTDVLSHCANVGATLAGIDSPAQKLITRNFIDLVGKHSVAS